MPASFVFRTNQGKAYTADTYFIFGKPSPVTINSVVASATPYTYPVTTADVSGTSITNGVNYKVLSFASVSTTTSYTINYTCNNATTIYVLAVGGGAGGNWGAGGGGGAGGVVMMPVTIPAGSSTIVVNVGAGGAGVNATSTTNGGSTTTVTFTSNQSANIYAYGGNTFGGSFGGSQGGSSNGTALASIPKTSNSNNYNYTNMAGLNCGGNTCPGGGGAGTQSCTLSTTNSGGIGGNGIQCFLPGISPFTPSGTAYGTYYWGGGGGGSGSSSGVSVISNGNGGLGGGGSEGGFYGAGGGGGINKGANGSGSSGGSGGANTGSGGGGVWTAPIYSGAGGSGIVVIAFPTVNPVTSNQSAVLPASILSSGLYSATLNNATLTSLAYNSIKGAYACRLLNYNYFGPIMTLRCSTDICGNYTQNFYSDICGNMGTGYLGTGQSVSTWLSGQAANTTYAFVTKWYGQGMDTSFNCATQYITTAQPIYDVSYGLINFGYTGAGGGVAAPQTGCYLSLPNGAFPYNNTAFTYSTRWYNFSSSDNQSFFSAGTIAGGMVAMYYFYSGSNYQLGIYNGTSLNSTSLSYYPSSSWTAIYDGTTNLYSYIAGTNTFTGTQGARNQENTNNQIGGGAQGYTGKIQMYDFYVFSTAISSADRALIEATPYQYSVPPTITGLYASQVTSTTFVLGWSTVSSAQTYALWINGSYFATYNAPAVTTGTVTPSTSGGLWTLNLYAYNSANVLLATGSTGAVMMAGAILSSNTGATQTTNGTNTVFTFTSSGTFTPITTGYASVLIVGGGGYGGSDQGSGGGAGGLVYFDSNYEPMLLTAGTAYTVTVGTGGVNSTSTVATNSSFNSVIATAGGSGAGNGSAGVSGGSSSGCGTAGTTQAASTQASYVTAYFVGGNKGGTSTGTNAVPTSGGGGGAGGAGGNSTGIAPLTGGSGGIGYQSNITGGNVYYSGGGGGMGSAVGGIGGSGIGGTGGTGGTNGGVGGNATGYGSGGGAGVGGGVRGGNGSNGVVIISCQGLTSITGIAATSVTSTNFVLSWTTVANISYILWINGINYGAVTTGSTITPGTSGPWTLGLYGYNASNVFSYYGTISGVFYQMVPFTTINSTSATVPSQFIGLSNTTYGGMSNTAVAVNWTQSKLLFISSKGIFYSTSSDGGTTWSTLTSLSTSNYGFSSISMSADGTQAIFASYNLSIAGYILWTGATPSAPVTLDSTVGYWYTSMTPDGTKACFGGITNFIYYATWNGTAYTWGGKLGSLPIQSGVAISPDGSVVIGSLQTSNTLFYATITWVGNTPTVSGATSLSQSGDERGLAFLGGGYSGTPTNIILQGSAGYGSKKIVMATWNNATKTVGTFATNTTMMNSQSAIDSVTTGNDGNNAFTPCGPNGNVIYYVQNVSNTPTSTSFNIGKATLNVT